MSAHDDEDQTAREQTIQRIRNNIRAAQLRVAQRKLPTLM